MRVERNEIALSRAVRQWTSIGCGFGCDPTDGAIDLERLLIDTAQLAPQMTRLFIMAATWLNAYGEALARHRLSRMASERLSQCEGATLGLLLEIAQTDTRPPEFQSIIRRLQPAPEPGPLFDVSRLNSDLLKRAEETASNVSRRWNLWCDDIELKHDALYMPRWITTRHPDYITRFDFRGDLRASILAALQFDHGAGDSELRLAHCAGGSRSQVRAALRNLELTGRITRTRADHANRIEIRLTRAA